MILTAVSLGLCLLLLLALGVYVRRAEGARRELRAKVDELLLVQSRLEEANRALATANTDLERLSAIDPLTGIANRRRLDEALGTLFRDSARKGEALGAAMVDIDHFKAYNDRYGHLAGDECLRHVAAAISSCLERPVDLAARYGGEEFLVLLPETGLEGARVVAERIRTAVDALSLPHSESRAANHVTVSVGYAAALPQFGGEPEDLVEAADRALYAAKERGRNRISD